jgi:general nucleoside transport system ATP-binding protein
MPVLEMKNISKFFPGITANDNIDFSLEKGEIHSILGENGAGKSTLMNILTGFYYPDKGHIYLEGREVKIHSPNTALQLGIGMVHQHFHLSEKHSIYENIILGSKKTGFIPDRKKLFGRINELSEKYGFDLNPDDLIWKIPVSEQQKVEILKVIFNEPDILIFDEPTAVLTSVETENFFNIIQKLRNDNFSIIFISHKLDEVLKVSDRITVLSKGRLVDTIPAKGTTRESLAEKMIGRKIIFNISKPQFKSDDTILSIKKVRVQNNRGLTVVNDLDLDVKKGEIFGIAGVSGNGQVEFAEALFGLRKMTCGSYFFNGKHLGRIHPKSMMKHGMKLIPADRKSTGSAIGMNMPDNFILNRSDHEKFSGMFLLKRGRINSETASSVDKYKIQHQGLTKPVRDLSGGNLQKVIVAREVESLPEFLIALYPSRGLDIGAIESLHKIMIDEQKKGATILLVSEELEELFNLADRIGVMYKGRIIKISSRENATANEIGLAMGGIV